ncbi:uncharacterized protein LOC115238484 [Formica exsecta]|uniref:uncharacterized protein LOC115238484 n=1 Tax=Formica exsecta TaxID=72781 RepID=UPI001144FE35|nr:uncharacterized protein LOC115238484 [Formica exsecta]
MMMLRLNMGKWELDFDDPSEPHDVQFVDVYDIDAEEDNYEDKVCIVDNEGGNVNLNYKRKAVEFWNSGKKGHLAITAVQNRFRKVKSVSQLHRWEENVMRGGSNRDKLVFIAEYVLSQFQEAIDRGPIIHDIDLRKWALQAKEQIDFPSFRAGNWFLRVEYFIHLSSLQFANGAFPDMSSLLKVDLL